MGSYSSKAHGLGLPPSTLSECQLCCVVFSATHSFRVSTMETMSVLEFCPTATPASQEASCIIDWFFWLIFWRFLFCFVFFWAAGCAGCLLLCLLAWCFFISSSSSRVACLLLSPFRPQLKSFCDLSETEEEAWEWVVVCVCVCVCLIWILLDVCGTIICTSVV
jgi:hypothetical protein